MSVFVTMRGALEPIEIENDFDSALVQLNVSAAKGMQYVVTKTIDGDSIMFNSQNILLLREVDTPFTAEEM